MANIIGIMGESGSGKTTAARTLDPKTTYYIDADRKGLSWRCWQKQYNEEAKNYIRTSDANTIQIILKGISDKRPEKKIIIVDTVNGIMIDDEMNRMREKGYDKWQDLAFSVYSLISDSHFLRDDLTVVFIFHVQDNVDENSNHHYHILTSGKKLEKIKLESKLTTLLFAKCNQGNYIFETQARNSTAKSPMGLFENLEIPNDLQSVITQLEKYSKGE